MKKIIAVTLCAISAPVLAYNRYQGITRDQAGGRDGGSLIDNLDIVSILIGLIIGILIGYLIWGRKK